MSAHPATPGDSEMTLDESLGVEHDRPDGPALVETSPQYLCLQWCTACFRTLANHNDVIRHLQTHDPEDFGLAPLGEGRRRSSDEIWGDTVPPWEARR